MALLDFIDPLDLGGRGAAESQVEASQSAADISRRFFDISQANLQPFLDLSNEQLAGLQSSATPGQAFDIAQTLRPAVDQITAPILQERLGELSAGLGAKGLTRSGFAAKSAADIQEDLDLSLLLQLQSQFTGRRQAVAGQGQQAGTALAQLGQQSGEDIASILSQGVLGAQQTRAAGQQNVLQGLGFGASFLGNQGQPALDPNRFLNTSTNVSAIA